MGPAATPSSGERRTREESKEKAGLRRAGEDDRRMSGEGEEFPREGWRGERAEDRGLSRH